MGADNRIEAFTFEKLHDQIGISTVISQLIDCDNIRMLQATSGLGLAKETLEQIGIVSVAARHHLDRDQTIEEGIGSLVNNPHAASTEDASDVVLTNLRWYFRGHNGPGPKQLREIGRASCRERVID